MKKGIVVFIFVLGIRILGLGQIIAWQFGNPASTGDETTYNATTNDGNLNVSVLSRGAGVNPATLARGFSSTYYTVNGTRTDAIANNKYMQFIISAKPGYKVSLSTLDVRLRRTSTGPNVYIWRYSLDGTTFTDIGSEVSFTSTADGVDQPQIGLTGIPALQNVQNGIVITMRIYSWGAASTGGTFAIGRYGSGITTNSLAIGGTTAITGGLTPPMLNSDNTNNDVDHNIDITFIDDASWRTAVTAVKIGGTALTPTNDYVLNSGDLQLKPSGGNTLLTTAGSKNVTVEAVNYTDACVIQVINTGAPTGTNSTAVINLPLMLNSSRTVTITAKDQYNNPVQGAVFKYDATVTNMDQTTGENYTVDATPVTSTVTGVPLSVSTNSSGVAAFGITIPAVVDGNDGISVQVKLNDGTTNVGSAFSFFKILPQITLIGDDPGTVSYPAPSADNILYRIQVDVINDAATLTQLQAISNGTYVAPDIAANGFKLRYSANSTFEPATDPVIGQLSSGSNGTGEVMIFTGLSQTFSTATAYLFIVADISPGAATGHTISCESTQNSDLLFTGSTFSGSSFAAASLHSIVGVPAPGEIVINQFSPDYSAASDEYIELLNRTDKSFDLSSLKIEYQSAAGSGVGAGGTLAGTLGPYQYWLLSPNVTVTTGQTNALFRDGSITTGFAYSGGQFALRLKNSPNTIIDGLAYGPVTTNNLGEGMPAVSPPVNGGLIRTVDGTDSNDNNTDFTTVANDSIYLRNSNSLNICGNYTIPGTSYNNLVISGFSPSVLLSGNSELSAKLTFITGSLTVASTQTLTVGGATIITGSECLVLKSDVTGTASFIDNGLSGTGTVKVERYLTPDIFHYISSPISDATANVFSGDYLRTSDPTMVTGWSPWIEIPTTPLEVMRGYACWKPSTNSASEVFSGNLNSGTKTFTVNRTATDPFAGWHLAGNPYPSAIDLTIGFTWDHFEPAAYFWNGSVYQVYPAMSGFGTHSQYAPAEEGFFVHISDSFEGNSTLTMTNAARVHNAEPFLKDAPEIQNALLVVTQSSVNGYSDKISVHFNPDATSGYDAGFDAYKLPGLNEAPQLYTSIGNVRVTCNSLPFENKNMVIPVGFICGINGEYILTADSIGTFEDNITISLEDLKLGTTQDLRLNPSYTFMHDTIDNADRFVLHFYNPSFGVTGPDNFRQVQIYSFGNEICIKSQVGNFRGGSVFVFDLIGREMFHSILSNQILNRFAPGLIEGYYFVKVVTDAGIYNGKVYLR